MDDERGQEAHWLLRYFTRPIDELWSGLPRLTAPRVVLTNECIASEPLGVLATILADYYLVGWGEYFDVDDPELDVLDDLRLLISDFLLERGRELLRPPESATEEDIIGTPYMFWRIVRRLCAAALNRSASRADDSHPP